MTEYRVRWEIDLEAESPRDAAEMALLIQRNPDAIATVFDVVELSPRSLIGPDGEFFTQDGGHQVRIDLDDLDEDPPMKCWVCGCTEDNACIIDDPTNQDGRTTCSWAAENLCSNPECVDRDAAMREALDSDKDVAIDAIDGINDVPASRDPELIRFEPVDSEARTNDHYRGRGGW